jgi:ABC-type multidrug transport system ATPase subunit
MALLETVGLAKKYGAKSVLVNLNLTIKPGEIVSVLGVNGAGKTTLLGCLGGLLGWTAGKVLLDGEILERANLQQRKRHAFLPDTGLWFPGFDPIRNAAAFAQLWKGEDAEPPLDLEEWMDRLGLTGIALDPIDQMSRGQSYKASLLALLTADPEIWLIDEPFSAGMDAKGQKAFRRLAEEVASRGRTVIYSTQFPEIASRFADHVIVLGEGHLRLDQLTGDHSSEEIERLLAQHLDVEDALA